MHPFFINSWGFLVFNIISIKLETYVFEFTAKNYFQQLLLSTEYLQEYRIQNIYRNSTEYPFKYLKRNSDRNSETFEMNLIIHFWMKIIFT